MNWNKKQYYSGVLKETIIRNDMLLNEYQKYTSDKIC